MEPDEGSEFEPEPLEFEIELEDSLVGVLPEDTSAAEDVLRETRTAYMELHSIFRAYSGDASAAATGDGASAADTDDKVMVLGSWQQICADAGVDGLPEVEEAFKSASGNESALTEVQFLAALIRLASALAEDMQPLSHSLYTLLYECVLPFARRDSSTVVSQVLSSRSYLLPYLDEIRGSFSGFGAPTAPSRTLH